MKVKEKTVKCSPGVTQENLELNFDDKAISKLRIKKGKRIDFRFKDTKVSYLKGLVLRYSPLTQKKIFYLRYRFNNKIYWLKLNEFILDHYGALEVSEELLKLYKQYYKNGRWKHNPKEQLITQRDLEVSQELSFREVIRRSVQAQFPRKGKIGKLAMSSQRTHARFLMGYHKRFDYLIFDENEKGWGTIKLKDGLDWKSFWDRFPPENYDPKDSDKEISVYDSNNLGPSILDNVTKGNIIKYLEAKERTYGTKGNLLDALQYLWNYAENKLKCFGDKPPPINPTQNIEILKDDETKFKGSKWNEISFDDNQVPQVHRAFVKLVRKRPFQSEALMLCTCIKMRPEEMLKLKKTDIKDGYILFRKETKKNRSKASKTTDEKIPITSEISKVLRRLDRQYKRKCHTKYKWIPWLFPSSRIDWGNPKDFKLNKTRRKSLNGAWEDVRKLISFGGSVKTLRKTYFTQKIELEKSRGKTTDEAIETVAKSSHKGPQMLKTRYYKEPESLKIKRAEELSKVIELKRKKH